MGWLAETNPIILNVLAEMSFSFTWLESGTCLQEPLILHVIRELGSINVGRVCPVWARIGMLRTTTPLVWSKLR
jgi:hypothetical protein